jgi:hypothetical protein
MLLTLASADPESQSVPEQVRVRVMYRDWVDSEGCCRCAEFASDKVIADESFHPSRGRRGHRRMIITPAAPLTTTAPPRRPGLVRHLADNGARSRPRHLHLERRDRHDIRGNRGTLLEMMFEDRCHSVWRELVVRARAAGRGPFSGGRFWFTWPYPACCGGRCRAAVPISPRGVHDPGPGGRSGGGCTHGGASGCPDGGSDE